MRNAIYRRSVSLTIILVASALMLMSVPRTARMQSTIDPAARKQNTIPIQLAPVPGPSAPLNQLIVDGGFETGGIPNTFWNPETSTNFGTPLCDVPSCGTGGGASPPRTGAFWCWFGGIPAAETATLGQTVTFPAGQTIKNLSFFMRIGTVSSPFTDVLNVRVDGNIVASFPEPTVAEAAYSGRVINLNAFADGVSHAILFEYIGPTTGTGSYVIDDIELNTRLPTATDGTAAGRITDASGLPIAGVAVNLNGTQNRMVVTDAEGNYRFENVETNGVYTVTPSRANFRFTPSQRSFSQIGQTTNAIFSGTYDGTTENPLNRTEYFVRQQYVDFLGREPDEAGLNHWVNNIEGCGGDQQCRDVKRADTSAAFFLSIEFRDTGFLVHRIHQLAYGDMPGGPIPLTFAEFSNDRQGIGAGIIVGRDGWQAALAQNKEVYANDFVQRSRFASVYPTSMGVDEFVDRLYFNAGVTPSVGERAAAMNEFAGAANTADSAARGRALLRVAESAAVQNSEFNQAFVEMQYFGYLHRDPNAEPDRDYSGYRFWLEKLSHFGGNYRDAEMIRAFLLSTEYRQRFLQ